MSILATSLRSAPTEPDVLPHLRPEPRRDQYGRYLLEGDPFTRATTVAHAIGDTFRLELWERRMVALGLRDPALYTELVSLDPSDRQALNRLCADAKERAGGNDRARIGTALHRVLEHVHAGRLALADVHPHVRADVVAADTALEQYGLVPMQAWIESVVALPEHRIAGMVDRAARDARRGTLPVVDLKTSATEEWSLDEWAMQVAIYAMATHYHDYATDRLELMPEPFDHELAYILHAPAGTGEAHIWTVDVAAGWRAVQLALEVRKVNGFGKDALQLVHSYVPAQIAAMRAETLRARARRMVELVPACAPVIAARFGALPTFAEAEQSGHRYTDEELDRIEAVLTEGEAAMGLPLASDATVTSEHGRPALTVVPPADPVHVSVPLAEVVHQLEGVTHELDHPKPVKLVPTESYGPPQLAHQLPVAHQEWHGCDWSTERLSVNCPTLTALGDIHRCCPAGLGAAGVGDRLALKCDDCGRDTPASFHMPDGCTICHTCARANVDRSRDLWWPHLRHAAGCLVLHPEQAEGAPTALAMVQQAFPGSTVVTVPKDDPQVLELVARVNALPVDLRGAIDSWARVTGMPNVLTGHATPEQVHEACAKVNAVTVKAHDRAARWMAELEGVQPEAIWPMVGLGPFLGLERCTDDEGSAIVALSKAVLAGFVMPNESDGALRVTDTVHLQKMIKAAHGGAQAAKLAAARWAAALGRPKEWRCTTVKAMAEHPVIGACLAFGPAIHTPDTAGDNDTTDQPESE